jgi:CRP/FNR family transcriptional regulator
MEPMERIAAIPLFMGLPLDQLRELARIVVTRSIKKGQIIFSEGEEVTGFYVLTSGRVKIFKLSSNGKEQILHIIPAGEPFGEAAVFAGKLFPAYAEAIENGQAIFFPRAAFIELVGTDPSLSLNMMAILSKRLRKFAATIEALSLKEVPRRLAEHLLYLSSRGGEREGFGLDISKNQLAALLGTIPETLSRILTRMAGKGLIETTGRRHIRILDRAGLRKLADGEKLD